MALDPRLEAVGRAARGEGAACLEIGQHDGALGVEDLRRLGHEVHAGEADDVGLGLLGGLRELQGVADEVGHVLHLAVLVVVREEHRVALALEAADFLLEVEVGGQIFGGAGCGDHVSPR